MPTVPEEVGQGIGEFGVEVQLRAEGEELPGLLEGEGAGEGEAEGAEGEDVRDCGGGVEVGV